MNPDATGYNGCFRVDCKTKEQVAFMYMPHMVDMMIARCHAKLCAIQVVKATHWAYCDARMQTREANVCVCVISANLGSNVCAGCLPELRAC